MITSETLARLPAPVRERIERFKTDIKEDGRHRELYLCKSRGYTEGLRDAGMITETERRFLYAYITL